MGDILASINTRKTPQAKQARPDQVKNNAGGYVFQIGDNERLQRFLTLGTDSNSYYQRAQELTESNAAVVFRMASTNDSHIALVNQILEVSEAGRAPKNKQAIFALAIAASTDHPERNARALAVMHKVCRTFTMLAQFNTYVENLRGRGPALNKAVANWYLKAPVSKVAYQAAKYRNREDWTHRDLLRLVKPGQYGPKPADCDALFDFITGKDAAISGHDSLAVVQDYLDAKVAATPKQWVKIINRGNGVSWEMLPDAAMKSPEVWEAMIARGIPQTALMRNLPRLTNVFGGPGNWVAPVAKQLQDAELLKKGRVHPVNVLVALRTYASGHSVRGSNSWHAIPALVDALDGAFYNSYGAVEPTGKRILVGLDVSGSMRSSMLLDYDDKGRVYRMPINAAEVATAIAMVINATEAPGSVETVVFTSGGGGHTQAHRRLVGYTQRGRVAVPVYQQVGVSYGYGYSRDYAVRPFGISNRRRLDDVLAETRGIPHGGTDCALPFTWAQEQGRDFDAVVIVTDNETWAGPIHVHQAADAYRNQVGHDVKLIAAAMTGTEYSVADPKDASGLNISGFDSAVPQLIGDFISGRI